jgi:hypothetical protein
MAHVRALLWQQTVEPKWIHRNQEKLHEMLGMEPPAAAKPYRLLLAGSTDMYEAIDRAKEYFGLNKGGYDKRTVDGALLGAMALVLFGNHGKGRAKGTKIWDEQKYLDLADAFWELKKKDETLSDAQICKRLGRGGDAGSAFKDYDPDHLRTLLPEARRAVREYFEDD